jgi:hypothetical protein
MGVGQRWVGSIALAGGGAQPLDDARRAAGLRPSSTSVSDWLFQSSAAGSTPPPQLDRYPLATEC